MKVLLVFAVALLPASVFGQAPQNDSVAMALQKVDSGAALRVRADRRTVYGKFVGTGTNALVLATPQGIQPPLRFESVEEIWRQGHYAKRGALIGGGIGAVLLTGFGWFLVSALCETDDCSGDYWTVAGYGIAIGGGGGALLGGGIGYLAKRWIKVY